MRSSLLSAPVPLLVLPAFAIALLTSCGRFSPPARAVVAIDEAFAAARPGLTARLQRGATFGSGPAGMLSRALIVPVGLGEGAGKALDAAIAERKRSGGRTVLVASPLIARTLTGNGNWTGDPLLLVPEWTGETQARRRLPGLWTASSDPVAAYRAAGEAAGAFVAALAGSGGSPSCGILFSEARSRPRAALLAFASAYAEASEGRPLFARELEPEALAQAGTSAPNPPKPGEGPLSASSAAQAAVAELLGSDIRVLFIALGSSSGAAIKAAERPGLAIGADFPAPESPASLAFRVIPDDRALAEALAAALRTIRGSRWASGSAGGMPEGAAKSVPCILIAGPAAASIRAGKLDFALFLENGPNRARQQP